MTVDVPTITRKVYFDAGHRVLGHENKCARLHGHRYLAEIEVCALMLDTIDRVIDFSKVKDIVGGWINENWDHNLILHENDPLLRLLKAHPSDAREVLANKEPYVMNFGNPTAERMTLELYEKAKTLLIDAGTGIKIVSVTIHETPNCKACFRPVQGF